MRWVVGVDGCRGGWLAIALAIDAAQVVDGQVLLAERFGHLLEQFGDAEAIAVDMPIGLWDDGRARPRPCDIVARARLGKRASTVFIPPTRAMLRASSYAHVRALGLSAQAYNLIPRIRELDSLLTPELQVQVWEAHPELSFYGMLGMPIAHPKRTPEGKLARRFALRQVFGSSAPALEAWLDALCKGFVRAVVSEDDVFDAFALAWSAWRHLRGESEVCIGEPARDSRGLLMAIRY